MDSNNVEATGPTSALHTLHHVPISEPYIGIMTRVLTEHGATLEETQNHPETDPPHTVYTITFPAGTLLTARLRMLRSRYFTIRFPDGYEQRGGELWPLHVGLDDKSTTVLYLPSEQIPHEDHGSRLLDKGEMERK